MDNIIELTLEEYTAVIEARECLNEFNNEVISAHNARRTAELNSGYHNDWYKDTKKLADETRDKGEDSLSKRSDKTTYEIRNKLADINNKNYEDTFKQRDRLRSSSTNRHDRKREALKAKLANK